MSSSDITNLYFFNNQYEDKTIWRSMIENRKKNFYQCLRAQENTQGFTKLSGNLTDFEINVRRNRSFGLPDNTYTLYLDHSIVPYYNKKRFLDKYGFNVPITLKQIIEDTHIFKYMVLYQIDNEFFFGLKIVEVETGCYLAIQQTRTDGLSNQVVQPLITLNSRWTIFLQNQVDTMYTFKNKYLIFTGVYDTDYYYIPLSTFTTLAKFDKPDTPNRWILYITHNTMAEYLMVSTNAVIVSRSGIQYVQIARSFATYIIDRMTNCKCYLMNQYQKANGFIYDLNQGTIPTFQVAFKDNPIPINNFYIYGFDAVNQIRTALIPYICTIQYPNIYEFTFQIDQARINPTHVYIEWYESTNSQTKFDNNFKDLTEFYGNDYPSKYLNGEFTEEVLTYRPKELSVYDFPEFMAFEDYPDLRSFRLQRLIEMLHDNPIRYKQLSKDLAVINKKSVRQVFRQSECPNIFSRSVMDTSGEVSDPNDVFYFSAPMMFVTVHTAEDIRPSALLFLNGVRINTERIHTHQKDAYIYFKRSLLKEGVDNVLDIEVFLYDTTKAHKIDSEIRFHSNDVSTIIPDADLFDKMTLSNLLFYDKKSSLYLDPSEIDYQYSMIMTILTGENGEEFELILDADDLNFFMTSASEYFVDEDLTYLMVRAEAAMIDCPKTTHKILNMNKLFLILRTEHRLNSAIGITNTNNYRKMYLTDGLAEPVVHMRAFKERNDANRFRVYYGGKLLRTDEYDLTLSNLYGGEVSVFINNISALDNNREVIFEYIPIDETIVFDAIPDALTYHDGLFWFDTIQYPLLPETMKVYIDGIRIPMNDIIDIGGNNIFKINGYYHGGRVTIYTEANDEYCYDYKAAVKVINFELLNNLEFRDYMIEKA